MATLKTQIKRQVLLHICMDVFLKSRLAWACAWDSAYKLVRTVSREHSLQAGRELGESRLHTTCVDLTPAPSTSYYYYNAQLLRLAEESSTQVDARRDLEFVQSGGMALSL